MPQRAHFTLLVPVVLCGCLEEQFLWEEALPGVHVSKSTKRKMRVQGIRKGNHVETKREGSKVPGR